MILSIGLLSIFLNYIIYPNFNIKRILLFLCFLSLINNFSMDIATAGGYNISIYEGIIIYNATINFNINYLLILFIFFLSFNHNFLRNNSYFIILSNLIGIILLIISNDLIMILISIELINLSLYILISNYTSGIKYFILSIIISTILLLSITLIYNSYGNLNIDY